MSRSGRPASSTGRRRRCAPSPSWITRVSRRCSGSDMSVSFRGSSGRSSASTVSADGRDAQHLATGPDDRLDELPVGVLVPPRRASPTATRGRIVVRRPRDIERAERVVDGGTRRAPASRSSAWASESRRATVSEARDRFADTAAKIETGAVSAWGPPGSGRRRHDDRLPNPGADGLGQQSRCRARPIAESMRLPRQ